MAIRRAMALVVALMFSASMAAAQQAPKPDNKKRSKAEQQEIEQVVKMIDGIMAGQPAPTDVTMTLEPFFMKSQEQRTFVPFVLTITNAPKTDAAMYVRVVDPSKAPDPKAKKVEYPWDDIHFVPAAQLAGETAPDVLVCVADATNLRLVLRLIEPTAGRVNFEGEDILALDAEAMRRRRQRMQVIFQDPYASLNPRMTVGAMLGEPTIGEGKAIALCQFLQVHGLSMHGGFAYGDHDSDIPMLSLADHPVAVGSNAALLDHARRHDWRISPLFPDD